MDLHHLLLMLMLEDLDLQLVVISRLGQLLDITTRESILKVSRVTTIRWEDLVVGKVDQLHIKEEEEEEEATTEREEEETLREKMRERRDMASR